MGKDGQFEGLPLVRLERVAFGLVSRDQGWVSDRRNVGTYNGAYSWFEACIWRRRHDAATAEVVPGGAEVSPLQALLLGDVPTFPGPGTQGFSGASSVFITPDPWSVRDALARRGWDFVPVPPVQPHAIEWSQRDASNADRDEEERTTWLIQRNAVASEDMRSHEVVWNRDDEVVEEDGEWPEGGKGSGRGFVATIEAGDRIGIWARCMVS
jgi:hypothetical protein